jgi:cell wall assembly regulator SMI1
MDFSSLWAEIRSQLETISPETLATLCTPASTDEISEIDTSIKTKLPEELKAWLAIHNGQAPDGDEIQLSMIDGFYLLSAKEIAKYYVDEIEMMADPQFDDMKKRVTGDGNVRAEFWNPQWFPFGWHVENADLLCMDMTPDKQGKVGQIFIHGYQNPARTQVAESLTEYFQNFRNDLKASSYTFEEFTGLVRSLYIDIVATFKANTRFPIVFAFILFPS